MEDFLSGKRDFGVNHDFAGYEVPIQADIPHQVGVFRGSPRTLGTKLMTLRIKLFGQSLMSNMLRCKQCFEVRCRHRLPKEVSLSFMAK